MTFPNGRSTPTPRAPWTGFGPCMRWPSSMRTTRWPPTRSGSATTTGFRPWWLTWSAPTRWYCSPISTASTTPTLGKVPRDSSLKSPRPMTSMGWWPARAAGWAPAGWHPSSPRRYWPPTPACRCCWPPPPMPQPRSPRPRSVRCSPRDRLGCRRGGSGCATPRSRRVR